MTEHSYNGWPASPTLRTRVITPVKGVAFRIVDNDNVADVFTYLAVQFDARVQRLYGGTPDDWGFAYRKNRNADNLSCHGSGTAVDFNATKHPNDVATSKTFTTKQITEIHKILAELDHVVRWGGDYTHTVDAMHFEIIVPPGGLQAVGKKLRTHAKAAREPAKPKTRGHNVDAMIAAGRRAAKANPATKTKGKRIRDALAHLLKIKAK